MSNVNNTDMRKGFTLVETTIVILIAGFVIGGVLLGQSVVGSAKITKQISQIQEFDSAVAVFQAEYKAIPGDAAAMGGNGDGALSIFPLFSFYPYAHAFQGEIGEFWGNLMPDQYVSANLAGNFRVTTGTNKNVPLSKIGSPGSFFYASTNSDGGCGANLTTTPIRNYYTILSAANVADAIVHNQTAAAVKVADLAAIDQKADDGIFNTGNVIAGRISPDSCAPNAGVPWDVAIDSNTSCIFNGVYNLNAKSEICTAMFRIGGQTGSQ